MKQLSITVLLLLGWLSAAAQHDLYNWQLKGYTGIANYYNTAKNTDDYFKAYDNLLYRFEVGRSLGNTLGLAAGVTYGNVRGLGQAGEAFTTEARMASVRLYFYTDNGWLLNTSAFVSPYFFGGYGLSTLQTDYNGASRETNQMQVVPFGLGLKFRLAERWQLDLHTEAVYNTKAHLTEVAPEQNDYNNTILHTGLSLAYSFGFKKSTFKAPVLYAGFLPPPAPVAGPARPARRSMLDYILELEPRKVQLNTLSPEDSLVEAARRVQPVAVPDTLRVPTDRLAVYDTIPIIKIDSLQLVQDTTGLRSKKELVQLPDSVDVDSMRRTVDVERAYRIADERATEEDEQIVEADTTQLAPAIEMLSDTMTSRNLRQQQMRLRERERSVRQREQDVRDREQEARERELDARERALDEAAGIREERARDNTAGRLTPAEQRERARVEQTRVQEPIRITQERPRTVYVPDTRTIRVDGNRASQVDPNTVLLLEQDRRELDAINRNNRQLRSRLDSLQAATAVDTSQGRQQGAPVTVVDEELLQYMQQQAKLNDSIMHRLGFYESELQRLHAAEAATPVRADVASTANVFFGLNSSTVPAASYDELLAMAALLKANPDLKLNLTGYTDQTGDAKYNMVLSRKRAAAVADFMKAQGIAATRITTAHAGEVESGGTANPAFRRVTLEITK
ncbi:OmpA family protein [Pontibacter sp. 172403-2]|uniref:OmpA family protein n=1 Tax=Pontibacter rufus TaxID=2791028 RepID=UPI0018AFE71A|nr:OmpA family protein [Pontibacter sp. 172403-2]MBF9253899.1 OmpA family protein [Pontibacter sp. 172403-2]